MRLINDPRLVDIKSQILIIILSLSLSCPVIAQSDGSNLKISSSPKNHKYGYVDQDNNVVISYQYQRAYDFYKGKAIVRKNDKYGIIDVRGKTVYPFDYTDIKLFRDQDVYVVNTGKANGTGAIDLDFKPLIPFEYSYIYPAGDVLIVIKIDDSYEYVSGAYSKTGKLIVPATIKGELKDNGNGYITNQGDGKGGLLTTTGELIIPFEHRKVELNNNFKYISVSDSAYTYNIYSMKGRPISDVAYDLFTPTTKGYFAVSKNGKWGIIKEDGVTIPCIYDEPDTLCFLDGAFILSKDGRYGLLDSTGKEIIPFTWERLIPYWKDLFLVSKDKKEGILNAQGQVIIPCTFDKIPGQPVNGVFILSDSRKKFGAIDVTGKQVVPFVLDEAYVKNSFMTASAYLFRLLEFDPLNPDIVYLDALGWYNSLKPAEALPFITKHIDKFGHYTQAPQSLLYLRAKAYTDLNNFKAAEDDALWANGTSDWGSKAYIYMGDKKFREKDFKAAEHYYLYAGLFSNTTEANELRSKAIAELKKLGQWVEVKVIPQMPAQPAVDLPVTIFNFTTKDKIRYERGGFTYLYTYDRAVAECPAGYRLPKITDWVNVIEYIMRVKGIDRSRAFNIIDYIGNGWKTEFYIQKPSETEHYVYDSSDEFDLNISPLRSHYNVNNLSYYGISRNVVRYWCDPGEINGRKANMIVFFDGGYDWLYVEDNEGVACVRYIKK